jgi:hypothetical protein
MHRAAQAKTDTKGDKNFTLLPPRPQHNRGNVVLLISATQKPGIAS